MDFSDGGELLDPDYGKSILEVYRDSVEVAIFIFQNTDVFTYITGDENPSWIPRWNQPMVFRNPFRFGRALPWKPASETAPIWKIDKKLNLISLTEFIVDRVNVVDSYNESSFGNAVIESDEGKNLLTKVWQRILKTVEGTQSQIPFNLSILTAAATSFSFGLDENTDPAHERFLVQNFVTYLKIVLDEETLNKYIPSDLSEESERANGHAFGKHVWDFKYPESSFFILENELIGCTVSTIRRGDLLCVALGSTYPLILRPDGNEFLIRGYAYVHRLLRGKRKNSERQLFRIR